jgi:hypothetical protein
MLATIPMTISIWVMERLLLRSERYPMPPLGQSTNSLAEKAGLSRTKNAPPHKAVTGFSHFSYGGTCGAVYGVIAPRLPGPPVVSGMLYGVGVWLASSMGWLPALGILPPATEQPRGRTTVMILAHLVWGAVMAMLVQPKKKQR